MSQARETAKSIVTQMCVGIGQTVGFKRNQFLEDAITKAIEEEAHECKAAMIQVRNGLSLLLPNPNNWAIDQWPVANEGDAVALNYAFQLLEDELGHSAYVADATSTGDATSDRLTGALCATSHGKPIIWAGHRCEGANLTPPSTDNFCLWTFCGRHDVPANEASEGEFQDVTCGDCINEAIARAF
jgi:hypothetical protein